LIVSPFDRWRLYNDTPVHDLTPASLVSEPELLTSFDGLSVIFSLSGSEKFLRITFLHHFFFSHEVLFVSTLLRLRSQVAVDKFGSYIVVGLEGILSSDMSVGLEGTVSFDMPNNMGY
jgi:hypothetical protein